MSAVEEMELQDERARAKFQIKPSLLAGLAVGVFLLAVSKGVVWSSYGLPDRVMGRPIFGGSTNAESFLLSAAIHLVFALCYSFAICGTVFRFRIVKAMFFGGIIALILYGINYSVFHFFIKTHATIEISVAITHLVFGLMTAGAYKAFAIPKAEPEANE